MEFWQGDMMDMDMDAREVMELSAQEQMSDEDWDEFFRNVDIADFLDSVVKEYGHEAPITIMAFQKAEDGASLDELKKFIEEA